MHPIASSVGVSLDNRNFFQMLDNIENKLIGLYDLTFVLLFLDFGIILTSAIFNYLEKYHRRNITLKIKIISIIATRGGPLSDLLLTWSIPGAFLVLRLFICDSMF